LKQIGRLLVAYSQRKGSLRFKENLSDYLGVEDLNVAEYVFKNDREENPGNLRIYDFPLHSKVQPFIDADNRNDTSDILHKVEDAIATFTGPTFDDWVSQVPNNGFYTRDRDLKSDFYETYPPGQRRGAFGFTTNGDLKLLTDEEKWSIVRSGYEGYRTLVGTSFYFFDGDSVFDIPGREDHRKSILSYLIQYQNSLGGKRNCFAISDTEITRIDMKKAIDDYMVRVRGNSYKAVEMEYNCSTCIVRRANDDYFDFEQYGGCGFRRKDHYLVTSNSK
jgi:hypothetical protein